jgi:alkyl sulfatase BDS1-like metallo-beta-lactamase superfamily hydrolase
MTYAQNHGGDPLVIPPQVGDVAEGVRICGGLGNALSVDVGDAILQLDSGDSPQMAAAMLTDLRAWRPDLPVTHLVYSHGHIGYNVGASTWLATANPAGAPPPVVVAQQNVPAFIAAVQRFEGLAHLNLWIEFAIPDASPPIEIVQPTVTFDQGLTIRGTTREVQLLAIPSETPDALAVWIPDVGVLHGGAAVTPTLPNSGEPTVVHADLDTWADSLERMDALGASRLVRGFGGTVDGTSAVHDVLSTMAAGLRWVSNTVADRMNQGWSLREILTADLHDPESIFGKDYMHDAHGARTLLLHAAWDSFAGWWDRNPTSLRPAPLAEAATAVLSAVEPETVLATARGLQAAGHTQLALHVIDLVALADPSAHAAVAEARALKADLCTQRMVECDDCWPIQQAFRAAGQVLRGEVDFHTGIL